jgi:hypothetical protein
MADLKPTKLPPIHKRALSTLSPDERLVRDRVVNNMLDDELTGDAPPITPLMVVERGANGVVANPTPPGADSNGDGEYYSYLQKRDHGDEAIREQAMVPAKSAGRPPRLLSDKELRQLDRLSAIHCTFAEIADILDVGDEWLAKNFSARIEIMRSTGKMSLRRKQFQKALVQEDTIMQIFLGKNLLGQSDRRDVEHHGEGGGPIRHAHIHAHTTWNIGGRDLNFKE